MHTPTSGAVLAAWIAAPATAPPLLAVHAFGEREAEEIEGRLAAMRKPPAALARASRMVRTGALEVCDGADARRLMGVWDAFAVEEAVRGSPPVKSSGLPFDEGTALGRLPDPRAWNVLEMRPVHPRHALKASCAAVETFRDGQGEARVAWRFKVDGTPGRIRTPSIGKDELKAWPRPRRPGSIGDLIVADALNNVIHTDGDGGVERELAAH